MKPRNTTLVTVSGPSGVGKTALAQAFTRERDVIEVVSHVEPLRPLRPGERWGVHWHRLDGAEMRRLTGVKVPASHDDMPVSWVKRHRPEALGSGAFAELCPPFKAGPYYAITAEAMSDALARADLVLAVVSISGMLQLREYATSHSLAFISIGLVPTRCLAPCEIAQALAQRMMHERGYSHVSARRSSLAEEVSEVQRFLDFDLEVDVMLPQAGGADRVGFRRLAEVVAEGRGGVQRFQRSMDAVQARRMKVRSMSGRARTCIP